DLGDADAETADREQAGEAVEALGGDAGAGADADDLSARRAAGEGSALGCAGLGGDFEASRLEQVVRVWVDALEQEGADGLGRGWAHPGSVAGRRGDFGIRTRIGAA